MENTISVFNFFHDAALNEFGILLKERGVSLLYFGEKGGGLRPRQPLVLTCSLDEMMPSSDCQRKSNYLTLTAEYQAVCCTEEWVLLEDGLESCQKD